MTIRATPNGCVMACDTCGHDRPVSTPADVALAVRLGWERGDPNAKQPLGAIATHRCPRCAAADRRNAA